MLGRVVHNDRAVSDGPVQQLMPRSRWWLGTKVCPHKQNLVVRMVRSILLEPGNQNIGIVFRSNAVFRNREIESVESERPHPHVGVIIGESRNDRPSLKIDDLGLCGSVGQDFLVAPYSINASA